MPKGQNVIMYLTCPPLSCHLQLVHGDDLESPTLSHCDVEVELFPATMAEISGVADLVAKMHFDHFWLEERLKEFFKSQI